MSARDPPNLNLLGLSADEISQAFDDIKLAVSNDDDLPAS